MPPFPDSAEALDDQAIEWIILLHSGKAGAEELAALARWRASSPGHDRAYREALELWQDAGDALAEPEAVPQAKDSSAEGSAQAGPPFHAVARRQSLAGPLPPRQAAASRRPANRRRYLSIAATVLLGLAGAIWNCPRLTDPLLHDYHTLPGELRQVRLEDGSRVLLDTDSALDVAFDGTARRVRLARGQALFQVAAEPGRPFEVEAADGVAQALGTVFDVRLEGKSMAVVVQEHAVAVRSRTARFPGEVRVETGERLAFSGARTVPRPEQAELGEATAWQRHKLIFDGRELSAVVEELNRYASGKILIADPSLRQRKVTGVFSTDEPEASLRAIQSTLQLRGTRLGPWLVLLHR